MIKEFYINDTARYVDLDVSEDEELNEIIELASTVSGCPIAAITILDEETLYLKVKKGTVITSLPRSIAFCAVAINQDNLLIVRDTLLDERFANNPYTTESPQLRFFASIPLKTQKGEKIGTLCVLDHAPRMLDNQHQLLLRVLSKQVVKILELKTATEILEKKQKELETQLQLNNDANIRLRSFFESSVNFQVLLGRNGEIIDFNKTAFNFIKIVHKVKLKRGDQFIKYLDPEFVSTFITQYRLALEGQKSIKEGSTLYDELGVIWWEASFETARGQHDEIIGISYIIRNVTERKLKEQKILSQNQSLINIAHIQAHEFRAPLTTIMGMINLIKEEDYNPPQEYIQFLEQAVETLDTAIRKVVSDIDKTLVYASTE